MKELWCDIRNQEINQNIERFNTDCVLVVTYKQYMTLKNIKNVMVVEVKNKEEIQNVHNQNIVLLKSEDKALFKYATERNCIIAEEYFVHDKISMIKAAESKALYIFVRIKDITNIPLELILAAKGENSKVIKFVYSCEEAEIAFGTMETGADGVAVTLEVYREVQALLNRLKCNKKANVSRCIIREIQHLGIGTRLCIDTIDILKKNEGCLVGSTINGAILVSSENHYLPYMNLRPFRVNAGAIHSYVLTDHDKTMYLSEIESGQKVLVVDTKGNTRQVVVGRAKIEKRPMIKITAEIDEIMINVIVQDDWHIRVFDGEGNAKSIRELNLGDSILGVYMKEARHTGLKINEWILEQ